MKSLKVKLSITFVMMFVAFAMLIVGIWAVEEAKYINLHGYVDFNVENNDLYIKDIRLQKNGTSQSVTLPNFMPGYFSDSLTLNVSDYKNDSSFTMYIDVINMTDKIYVASTSTNISGEVSGAINADNVQTITSSTGKSGTVTLSISSTSSLPDNVTINFDEFSVISSNSTLGTASYTADGDQITLQTDFTGSQDAEFLGWRIDSENGELVTTNLNYSFAINDLSSALYIAIFRTLSSSPLTYNYNYPSNGEAEVVDCQANVVDLIIPSTIYRSSQLYLVTQTSSDGFSNVNTIETLILPSSLKVLGGCYTGASNLYFVDFSHCTNLTYLYIEGTAVTNIDLSNCLSLINLTNDAFNSCENLVSIKLPENLQAIGNYAFAWCTNLTNIELPSSIESVANYAFDGCTNLTYHTSNNGRYLGNSSNNYLVLMDTVTDDFTTFTINSNCRVIADNVFASTDIESITIPANVVTIGDSAFADTRLETIEINTNSNLKTIGNHAFDSSYIANIDIPASVETIGDYAFSSSELDTITFEAYSNLKTIGELAFAETYIETITIPASVESIGENAFNYCGQLNTVEFEIGSHLKTIGDYAFSDARVLEVTIPASVEYIGSCAFSFEEGAPLTSATFLGNNDWQVSQTQDFASYETISSSELRDSANAAKLLQQTYWHYYWRIAQ